MKKIVHCRCCGSKNLYLYLNLGEQPLANSYHKGEKLRKFPLEVVVCKNCFHSQLSIVVKPDLLFKNYLYVSGTTDTFKNHCEALALDAIKKIKSNEISVLDIACNDGLQLEIFRALGCKVLGVDPAENLRSITKEKKIPVLVKYWNLKLAKKMKEKFNIITATNVFAHVHDVQQFLQAAKFSVKTEGLIILEFPYAQNMVRHNEFDTVYHEHLSYFLVNSFSTLVSKVGLTIVDIMPTPIHGGSIRFFLSKSKNVTPSKKVKNFILNEKRNGLLKVETYKRFAVAVLKNKEKMKKLIYSLQKAGTKIIGYAASAKGNTMLNYFKLKLDYIVDDNNLKWGNMTPGMNILIKDPLEIRKESEDLVVVILAWNFYNEIAKRIISIRLGKHRDRAILYVPKVKIIEIQKKNTITLSA